LELRAKTFRSGNQILPNSLSDYCFFHTLPAKYFRSIIHDFSLGYFKPKILLYASLDARLVIYENLLNSLNIKKAVGSLNKKYITLGTMLTTRNTV